MKVILVLLLSYLLGSIPWGYSVGRWYGGIDLRRYGSGNIGATNAFRVLGPKAGFMVLAGDVLKGMLAVALARVVGGSEYVAVAAGLAAIAGHNWSLFLSFRGGRGVATAAGVILALVPLGVLVLFIVWCLVVLVTRYVSLGSITVAAIAPFVLGWAAHSWLMAGFGLIAGAVVIYRHWPNIMRLRRGLEPRIGERGIFR